MTGELVYSVEITVVRYPGDGDEPSVGRSTPSVTVRYCDICRRWGMVGSTHICWRNWRPRLSDLLIELGKEAQP